MLLSEKRIGGVELNEKSDVGWDCEKNVACRRVKTRGTNLRYGDIHLFGKHTVEFITKMVLINHSSTLNKSGAVERQEPRMQKYSILWSNLQLSFK